MEKKLISAVIISTLILIIWSGATKKYYPVENKVVTSKNTAVQSPRPTINTPRPEININELSAFNNDYFTAYFIEKDAAIWEIVFKKYKDSGLNFKHAFFLGDNGLAFKKSTVTQHSIAFTAADKEKRIDKIFKFDPKNYALNVEIVVENISVNPIEFRIPLILGEFTISNDNQGRFDKLTISSQDKIKHLNLRKTATFHDISFISYGDRYFTVILGVPARLLDRRTGRKADRGGGAAVGAAADRRAGRGVGGTALAAGAGADRARRAAAGAVLRAAAERRRPGRGARDRGAGARRFQRGRAGSGQRVAIRTIGRARAGLYARRAGRQLGGRLGLPGRDRGHYTAAVCLSPVQLGLYADVSGPGSAGPLWRMAPAVRVGRGAADRRYTGGGTDTGVRAPGDHCLYCGPIARRAHELPDPALRRDPVEYRRVLPGRQLGS